MIDTCREAGVLFALHDNYIDLYPDAEGFSYEQNIAFSGNRRPVRAWINRGREAQSYRYRADQVEQFLKNQSQSNQGEARSYGVFHRCLVECTTL